MKTIALLLGITFLVGLLSFDFSPMNGTMKRTTQAEENNPKIALECLSDYSSLWPSRLTEEEPIVKAWMQDKENCKIWGLDKSSSKKIKFLNGNCRGGLRSMSYTSLHGILFKLDPPIFGGGWEFPVRYCPEYDLFGIDLN